MSDNTDKRIVDFATMLQLEKLARASNNKDELGFVMVNETIRLVSYLSSYFWVYNNSGFVKINTASGAESVNSDAPLTKALRVCVKRILKTNKKGQMHLINKKIFSKKIQKNWDNWFPKNLLWCPLKNKKQEIIGGLIFTKQKDWKNQEIALIELLLDAYSHALSFFVKNKRRAFFSFLSKNKKKNSLKLALMVAFLMFMPITQSVLAPATVVPKQADIINSPLNGVIKKIFVKPNQQVKKGDLLLSFEETDLINQYETSKKALEVARAELRKSEQLAFSNPKEQANVVLLQKRIELHQTQTQYTKILLENLNIKAKKDGIAVFSDVSDWEGRPVSVGQKIMSIANQNDVELELMIPAEDAINLEKGAKVKAYLNINPLDVYKAKLKYASYAPIMTEKGYYAYKAKAKFDDYQDLPRTGLQANAKIFGQKVTLFYYLLRKPLALLRRFVGM